MITVIIEKLSEGYVVENDGKRFAVTQDRMIQKVKSLLGITHFKNKKVDNSVPKAPQRSAPNKDIIEPVRSGITKEEQSDSILMAPKISTPRKDRKDKDPSDHLRIEGFEWDRKKEISFKTIFFIEMNDGRVMISYSKGRYFTTKENVLKIPYPIPNNYLVFVKSANNKQAVARYREYLYKQDKKKSRSNSVQVSDSRPASPGDRNEKDDPDRAFKPMLNGAFSTKTDYDGSKLEGTL